MEAISFSVNDLVLDPRNARKHNTKNINSIKGSLKKFGQQKPIVITQDGIVIAGNGTLEAAKQLGWENISVVKSKLSEKDIKAYAIADNRTSELAEWDFKELDVSLKDLLDDGFDLESIGFDKEDLEKFLITEEKEGLTDPDAIPENVETRCKLGDLWVLGEHRLLCGDSTDVLQVEKLMGGEKADMVFTDPPYGINLETDMKDWDRGSTDSFLKEKRGNSEKNLKHKSYKKIQNDDKEFDLHQIANLIEDADEVFIFGGDYFLPFLSLYKGNSWLVWDKRDASNLDKMHGSHFELCWSKKKHQRKMLRYTWSGIFGMGNNYNEARQHPTQKPLKLLENIIITWSKEGHLIQDPFLGSGSTLIACEKTGRKCYGMEIDPHYCDVILKRWEDFTGGEAQLAN